MLDLQRAQRLRFARGMRDRDPLAYWHHMSEESREATRLLSEAEVYCRWPNWTGKTAWGAAAVVSMLQGREALDGVTLPKVRDPAAAVLCLDYEQQKFSVQPAYLAALGQWPHRATWKGDGILSTLRVKPLGGGDDESRWPMATFVSQENRRAGTGARVPIVHADEPPRESIWREFRKSKRFGERSVRLITATPLVRAQWAWLKDDYEGCLSAPHRGRVEVHMPDVRRSRIVDETRYAELLDEYRGDPLIDARLTAAYVDVSGSSPWPDLLPVLRTLLDECVDGEVQTWEIRREVDGEGGRAKVTETVDVEVWVMPNRVRRAYIDIDPSQGINDKRHDPGGLCVWCRDTGDLLARYNGYVGAYGLGVLAASLARQYHDAVVDPETTGGWGGPVLTALHDCGYSNVAQQRIQTMPGKWESRLGFRTTAETRPAMFESIRQWLLAKRAGMPYARVPSRDAIQSLLDLTLDEKGKPLAAPGLHDEDPILLGHSLQVLNVKPGARVPVPLAREPYRPGSNRPAPWTRERQQQGQRQPVRMRMPRRD